MIVEVRHCVFDKEKIRMFFDAINRVFGETSVLQKTKNKRKSWCTGFFYPTEIVDFFSTLNG